MSPLSSPRFTLYFELTCYLYDLYVHWEMGKSRLLASLFTLSLSHFIFMSKEMEILLWDTQRILPTVLEDFFSTSSSECLCAHTCGRGWRPALPSLPLWFLHFPLPGCLQLCLRTPLQKHHCPTKDAGSASPEGRQEEVQSPLGLEEYCKKQNKTVYLFSSRAFSLHVCIWKRSRDLSAWRHCTF